MSSRMASTSPVDRAASTSVTERGEGGIARVSGMRSCVSRTLAYSAMNAESGLSSGSVTRERSEGEERAARRGDRRSGIRDGGGAREGFDAVGKDEEVGEGVGGFTEMDGMEVI